MAVPPAPGGATPTPSLRRDTQSVSPVVGTILILAVTIAGITAALFWGAPVLQRLRDQSDLQTMTAQFTEVREATLRLSGADSGRAPGLSMPSGQIELEPATWVLVTVNHDAANPNCDFRVTEWEDDMSGLANNQFQVQDSTSCRTPATVSALGACVPVLNQGCVRAYEVQGETYTDLGATNLFVLTSFNLGTPLDPNSDYLFRMEDGAGTTVYMESWLFSGKRLSWTKQSSQGGASLDLEGGALFATRGGTVFQVNGPRITEGAFGDDDVLVRFPDMAADGINAVSGTGNHNLLLTMTGSYMRPSDAGITDATRLRYDFYGTHAEAWCNSLLLRNIHLAPAVPYSQDSGLDDPEYCRTADIDGDVVSIIYDPATPAAFGFRLLHANVQASLQV